MRMNNVEICIAENEVAIFQKGNDGKLNIVTLTCEQIPTVTDWIRNAGASIALGVHVEDQDNA